MDERDPLAFFEELDEAPAVETTEGTESATEEALANTEAAPAATSDVVEDNDVQPNEQGMVPHAALHAARQREKDRVAKLEAEIASLKSGKTTTLTPPAGTETAPANSVQEEEEEEPIPSITEDPQAWAEYQERTNAVRALNINLNNSERFARDKHGAEKVDEALAWLLEMAPQYPDTYKRIIYHSDPYKVMLELHEQVKQRDTVAGLEPTDVEAFKAWKAAQATVNNGQTTTTTTPAVKDPKTGQFTKTTPPKSLATAPSDGKPVQKTTDTAPGSAFEATFN